MATQKKKSPAKKSAAALHAKNGVHHAVGLTNIRVVIVPDSDAYFAQGLDLDYAAQGTSIPEVKENFENGMRATIKQHLTVYGHLKNFLKVAPAEICQNLLLDSSARFEYFSQISGHEIHEAMPGNIQYLVASESALSAN